LLEYFLKIKFVTDQGRKGKTSRGTVVVAKRNVINKQEKREAQP
jgi:hypothetical protein